MITDDRLKQIMKETGLPNSISIMQALRQVDMEAELQSSERIKALEAQNADMREALNNLLNDCINFGSGNLTEVYQIEATKVLASTKESGDE